MHYALGWLVFAAWAVPAFVLLELHFGAATRWRVLTVAIAWLAVDVALTAIVAYAPPPATLARGLAAFAVAELLSYGAHRAMHHVPLLWRFHRLHHRDEPVAWHRAWLVHPVDTLLYVGATAAACALVAAPLPAAGWVVVTRRAWAALQHARVPWPTTVADSIVATPTFHRRHHREDLAPANFAATFAFVDHVFGTWAR